MSCKPIRPEFLIWAQPSHPSRLASDLHDAAVELGGSQRACVLGPPGHDPAGQRVRKRRRRRPGEDGSDGIPHLLRRLVPRLEKVPDLRPRDQLAPALFIHDVTVDGGKPLSLDPLR